MSLIYLDIVFETLGKNSNQLVVPVDYRNYKQDPKACIMCCVMEQRSLSALSSTLDVFRFLKNNGVSLITCVAGGDERYEITF